MWDPQIRAGRCYLEDFCVLDPGCPFLRSCIRSQEDTEPMAALAEPDPVDRLIADLFPPPTLMGRLRSFLARFRVSLP